MTAARVAKLEALGFTWELSAGARNKQMSKGNRNDAGWEAQLAKLKAYKGKHGNCNVPQGWADDPRLSIWVCTQRKCKKKLDRGDPRPGMTAARAAMLDALGFAWVLSAMELSKQNSKSARDDAGWKAQLAKLNQYKRKHGDCNVPWGWTEDEKLASWVSMQRRLKKVLDRGQPSQGMTAARAAKLEALGFAWELSAAGWEAQLAKLKAYKRRRGDCNVLQRWAEDPALGNWVKKQRHYKKALDCGEPGKGMTAARVAKLEALGFAWEIPATELSKQKRNASWDDAGWEAQLVNLEKYTVRHGDCNVPYGWAEDKPLGRWVGKQRRLKKNFDRGEPSEGMTAARVARLEALGFVWEISSTWEAQLAKLEAYKRRHGDCNVPRSWAEDPALGFWVKYQRACKKALDHGAPCPVMTAARVAKLNTLGFTWERR
jgi:hypothetical protein